MNKGEVDAYEAGMNLAAFVFNLPLHLLRWTLILIFMALNGWVLLRRRALWMIAGMLLIDFFEGIKQEWPETTARIVISGVLAIAIGGLLWILTQDTNFAAQTIKQLFCIILFVWCVGLVLHGLNTEWCNWRMRRSVRTQKNQETNEGD